MQTKFLGLEVIEIWGIEIIYDPTEYSKLTPKILPAKVHQLFNLNPFLISVYFSSTDSGYEQKRFLKEI